ncbi:effector-associated constant component EACC1 [Actinacidiphila bryophytorum]|uniref:effector-associated constant component EACC1 n=1 Tax=Actinacidiphila bryophytorum TaxID=1436133 RepID=UPI001980A65E|nr:hypothetical protein [Actinacidiphila bryophytorum]MBN6543455.1 hypothetical protein [Actinacidiphila bryophytorum]
MDETGTAGGALAAAGEVEVVLTPADPAAPATAADDLRSLLRWLRADETLTGLSAGRIRDGEPPQPGAMGLAFDVLQLTIGSGLSAGALAVSVAQWRDARRRPPGITLRRGRTTVEIPATGPVDVAALARALQVLGAQPADVPLPAAAPAAAAPAAAPVRAAAAVPPMPARPPLPAQEPAPVPEPARAANVRTGEAAGDGTPS